MILNVSVIHPLLLDKCQIVSVDFVSNSPEFTPMRMEGTSPPCLQGLHCWGGGEELLGRSTLWSKSYGQEQNKNVGHLQEDHTSGLCSPCTKEESPDLMIPREPQAAHASLPCTFILCIQAPSQGCLYHSHSTVWGTVHSRKEFSAFKDMTKTYNTKRARKEEVISCVSSGGSLAWPVETQLCQVQGWCPFWSSWALLTERKTRITPKPSCCSKFSAHQWGMILQLCSSWLPLAIIFIPFSQLVPCLHDMWKY